MTNPTKHKPLFTGRLPDPLGVPKGASHLEVLAKSQLLTQSSPQFGFRFGEILVSLCATWLHNHGIHADSRSVGVGQNALLSPMVFDMNK